MSSGLSPRSLSTSSHRKTHSSLFNFSRNRPVSPYEKNSVIPCDSGLHPVWTLRSTPTKMKYRRCSPDENHSVIPYELRLHTVWKSCSVLTKVKYQPRPWVQIKTILWFHNYELRQHTVWKFCPCVQIKTILWFRRNFTLCERHVIPQQKRNTDYALARESYEQQTVWTLWSTLTEVVYRPCTCRRRCPCTFILFVARCSAKRQWTQERDGLSCLWTKATKRHNSRHTNSGWKVLNAKVEKTILTQVCV